MTQKEKELLLKDLSARLPYNVYIYFKTRYRCNAITDVLDGAIYTYIETHLLEDDDENEIDIIKPYLRPMSSMTEEEKKELQEIAVALSYNKDDIMIGAQINSFRQLDGVLDLFNSYHLDWRGLIEKGFAIEAPKDMYK